MDQMAQYLIFSHNISTIFFTAVHLDLINLLFLNINEGILSQNLRKTVEWSLV